MPQHVAASVPAVSLVTGVGPPRRTDARRNYKRLLAAASDLFVERGPDAPLDEIAKRAGVGNATLYRHFPTRRDLLVAVCVGDVEALCRHGNDLRATHPPAEALAEWLWAFIEHVTAKQGLAAALLTGRDEDSAVITACQRAIDATGAALLERAQTAGAVRPDLGLGELLRLVNAIAIAAEPDGAHGAERLLSLVLDGVRRRTAVDPAPPPGARPGRAAPNP
ncbi:TetR/AcrR family transcriptional regulator [Pseudonocardia acaciae]|uniref:TetR/AcrR family transcriptional regulator n=1 Tax=Pseudonocardia acaciae TaxID=551276 RepID=UPI0006846777|nr:TetR/AcrR family transcriptional regulator [Pseudonocardia acaciae]